MNVKTNSNFLYYIYENRMLVRPVVTYGSGSWTLIMEQERALAVSEREILRKIYGPVKEMHYGEFDETMN